MKLVGVIIASIVLVACSGGGSDPVKTEKVWKLVEKVEPGTFGPVKTTFNYDGSGLLEKQVFDSEHFEFIYNDQGVLLEKKAYNAAEGGELVRYEKFDKYGEVTRRLTKRNGFFKKTIVYVNKYPDNLDINNKETQKEIQQYVQRKILVTRLSNELFPYLGSKIISRERKVTEERIEEFDFTNSDEILTNVFEYPDDRKVDRVFHAFYDKYGIRLFGSEYDYEEYKNGNLKVATDKATGSQIHYKWRQMDIPVQ